MSGVELCWETRLLATYQRPIYVLMMSTQYDHRSLIEALDSGADDFIGKPPLAEELYARLRAAERIASIQRELIRLAITDPLTGLCNRRGFFEQATEACARTAAPDGSLSAIILDIDNFKQINDSYGHETGDEAIRACARAARMEKAVTGRRQARRAQPRGWRSRQGSDAKRRRQQRVCSRQCALGRLSPRSRPSRPSSFASLAAAA
jgi:PleD family two-component response regulator